MLGSTETLALIKEVEKAHKKAAKVDKILRKSYSICTQKEHALIDYIREQTYLGNLVWCCEYEDHYTTLDNDGLVYKVFLNWNWGGSCGSLPESLEIFKEGKYNLYIAKCFTNGLLEVVKNYCIYKNAEGNCHPDSPVYSVQDRQNLRDDLVGLSNLILLSCGNPKDMAVEKDIPKWIAAVEQATRDGVLEWQGDWGWAISYPDSTATSFKAELEEDITICIDIARMEYCGRGDDSYVVSKRDYREEIDSLYKLIYSGDYMTNVPVSVIDPINKTSEINKSNENK